MNNADLFLQDVALIEEHLTGYLPKVDKLQSTVEDAMRYSVLNGGKRIRGVLVLESCRMCGGDLLKALPFACATEMIHAYSLIHDDLPCMDDDDLRRGKPSCHIAFDEATALLAGDALLTRAFEILFTCSLDSSVIVKAGAVLSQAIGTDGMIGGQVIDMICENTLADIETIKTMHRLKTGALIRASAKLGCIAANANDESIKACDSYAGKIGLAFQIIDDILDISGDVAALGKPVGSDLHNHKTTFVTAYGLEKSKELAAQLTEEAKNELKAFESKNQFLCYLADVLVQRNK